MNKYNTLPLNQPIDYRGKEIVRPYMEQFERALGNDMRIARNNFSTLRIEKSNRIWIEVYLLLWLIFIFGILVVVREFEHLLPESNYEVYSLAGAMGATVFIFHIVFSGLYLCGIRKIRQKNIFQYSIIVWLFKKIKQGALETYDNGHLVSRTWLPYLLFLCLNLVLVLWVKRCFERDPKMIKTAQADYDIAEDLLNDVLGIKKEKK